jgi:hypothetical protein
MVLELKFVYGGQLESYGAGPQIADLITTRLCLPHENGSNTNGKHRKIGLILMRVKR